MVQHGTINVLRDFKKKRETKTKKKFNYDGRGMITHTHIIIKKFQGILHVYPLLLLLLF
jgi:hypothetical protein